MKEHAETTSRDVHSDDEHLLEKDVMNDNKRLFLESFHSCNDNASKNGHNPKYTFSLKIDNRINGQSL